MCWGLGAGRENNCVLLKSKLFSKITITIVLFNKP